MVLHGIETSHGVIVASTDSMSEVLRDEEDQTNFNGADQRDHGEDFNKCAANDHFFNSNHVMKMIAPRSDAVTEEANEIQLNYIPDGELDGQKDLVNNNDQSSTENTIQESITVISEMIPTVDQTLESLHSLRVWDEHVTNSTLWIPEIFLCIYMYIDDVFDIIQLSRTCQADLEDLQIIYGYCKGLVDYNIKSIIQKGAAEKTVPLNRLRILEVQQEHTLKTESSTEKIIIFVLAIIMLISIPYSRSIMFYIGYIIHIVATLFGSMILYVEFTDLTKYVIVGTFSLLSLGLYWFRMIDRLSLSYYFFIIGATCLCWFFRLREVSKCLVVAAFSLFSWKIFWFQLYDDVYPVHYLLMLGATLLAAWFVRVMILQSKKEFLKHKFDIEKQDIQKQISTIDVYVTERVLQLKRASEKIPLVHEGTTWSTFNVCRVM
ncbi:hypothetical protein C9374_006835 [Naegleria lovaniensis]|uniref:Uncharacterized protein n=1 Tax=Naegleria lovaniensis TaxID=51637 RepID=A0AA88H468_NAELO|nr:uncharacterized protein C9374_006835 [Naegleria lovaniensis]KAG2393304.1 hypothetical protein C9374_006835 [Naegleria lovaniensis]